MQSLELPHSAGGNSTSAVELDPCTIVPLDPSPINLEREGITSQLNLFNLHRLDRDHLVQRMDADGFEPYVDPIRWCSSQATVRKCLDCGDRQVVFNHCDNLYCPICQPRIAKRRARNVHWWTKLIKQPKHVVLTVKNWSVINKEKVKWLKQCFSKLRRRKVAASWKGGFYSLETTNNGKGWHVHLHVLVDSKWFDARKLSESWADITGQQTASTIVKDARGDSYLQELLKYAVKGTDLLRWSPADVASWIDAFDGVRTFGIFGSLYGRQQEWKEAMEALHEESCLCAKCGGAEFSWESQNMEWYKENVLGIPPPPENQPSTPQPQVELALSIR